MSELLSEKLYLAKKEWASLDKAASFLEEIKKSILGGLVEEFKKEDPKISIAMAEHKAYASKDFKEHIALMTAAREKAHIQFGVVEGVRIRIDEEKSRQIREAVEMKYSE